MLRIFIGTIALAGAVQGVAQAPPAAPADKPQVWDLEWDEPHCTVTTATEDGSALMLSMMPGEPEPLIYFLQGGAKSAPKSGDPATITLEPSGKTIQTSVWYDPGAAKGTPGFGGLGAHFPEDFAQSTSISVRTANRQASIPVAGADKAMAAVRDCLNKKLTEWGIDAAAYDALQKPPTEIKGHYWMEPNDYPMDAVMANWSGDVVARLAVDAAGKVTGCKILVSGGLPSMDAVTCSSAMKRGKYEPAVGADGKPTAAFRVVDVGFRVMDHPPK